MKAWIIIVQIYAHYKDLKCICVYYKDLKYLLFLIKTINLQN